MNILDIFACPLCNGQLEHAVDKYICKKCSSEYPIVNDVPVFLTEGTISDSMKSFWDKGWENRFNNTDHTFLKDETYEELRKRIQDEVNSKLEENEHAITETLPINEKIILNIGCGLREAPGFVLLGAKNYIGIDFSYFAAKYSHEVIKKLYGTGLTAQANAEKLPINSGSINIVYSHGVLHHTPETQTTLDEIYRVLDSDGKGIIGLYNTWSATFITARIVGIIKSFFQRGSINWYEDGEGAWRTEENLNPWTKTYSLKELKILFSKYELYDLNFRKTSFSWANAIPKIGKHIARTHFGRYSARKLQSIIGSMWVITFKKK
tara:strand:+ start:552 stop:1517 length:966 start_codon:yes stop_codon:yes gene_type:complete